jgi:hypothetical protein
VKQGEGFDTAQQQVNECGKLEASATCLVVAVFFHAQWREELQRDLLHISISRVL